MTHEATVIADVRMPKRYRNALAVGIMFGGIAMLLAFIVILPIVRASTARQTRFDQESLCRATINYAATAVVDAQIADQSDAFKASIDAQIAGSKVDGDRVRALAVEFDRDIAIAAVIQPILADAVGICHRNPHYSLPPEALNPGVP